MMFIVKGLITLIMGYMLLLYAADSMGDKESREEYLQKIGEAIEELEDRAGNDRGKWESWDEVHQYYEMLDRGEWPEGHPRDAGQRLYDNFFRDSKHFN